MQEFKESLIENLEGYYLEFSSLLPKIAIGFIVLLIFWLLSKYVVKGLRVALQSRLQDPLIVRFILKTSRTILFVIAILAFLKIVGLGDVAVGIWGTAGIGAFILGFAFKDIGEHFIAGFILAFNRPFQVGDIIESGGHTGTVTGLNLRTTQLKTFDGKDVYIPNGNVIKQPLINFTIDGYIRKEFVVGIEYTSDQDKAIDLILGILRSHKDVIQEQKPPAVVIGNIDKSALRLKAMYWLDTFNPDISSAKVERELVRDTIKALQEEGIYRANDLLEIKGGNNTALSPAE